MLDKILLQAAGINTVGFVVVVVQVSKAVELLLPEMKQGLRTVFSVIPCSHMPVCLKM